MNSPFDALAPLYTQTWSDAPEGRKQREQVWRAIESLFPPGSHVLDIGCGIGDDALHLSRQGVRVSGIDPSPAMTAIARERGVQASCMALADLSGRFDGALSNFGAFNCIEDWSASSAKLARLLVPGAPLALCVMPRFRLIEPRRWRGRTTWRGLDVYYRSRWETNRAFAPHFEWQRTVSIGGGDHALFLFTRRSVYSRRGVSAERSIATEPSASAQRSVSVARGLFKGRHLVPKRNAFAERSR